jgi:microcystin-dependent protein
MSEPFLGEIRAVGFSYAPSGWALCDGRALSISQNNALFALLGTTFGGDGTTNFNLPDLRGRSMVGIGTGPGLTAITQGEKSGGEAVTLTQMQMPVHTHIASLSPMTVAAGALNGPGTTSNPSGAVVANFEEGGSGGGTTVNSFAAATAANATMAPATVQGTMTINTAGGSQPLPLRNPYNGTNFIIALEGIFPSRP